MPAGRISEHAPQRRDHYIEKQVAQSGNREVHGRCAFPNEAVGEGEVDRCCVTARSVRRDHFGHNMCPLLALKRNADMQQQCLLTRELRK